MSRTLTWLVQPAAVLGYALVGIVALIIRNHRDAAVIDAMNARGSDCSLCGLGGLIYGFLGAVLIGCMLLLMLGALLQTSTKPVVSGFGLTLRILATATIVLIALLSVAMAVA